MKKTNIFYWILTVLSAGFMAFSSISNILVAPEAVELVVNHLHYPEYFLRFIGVAKLLGAIAILIPGFPRIKEWAYAGLIFDLTAAWASMLAVGDPIVGTLPMLLFIAMIFGSYYFHHKRLKANAV